MIKTETDFADIKHKAIDLLARREHARGELKTKLQKRFSDNNTIEAVLDHLISENLQSDERFTESYITYRQNAGFGPYRIQQELKERGINSELISTYLDTRDDHWQETADNHILKKYHHPFNNLDMATKAKALRFLQSRGFDTNQFSF